MRKHLRPGDIVIATTPHLVNAYLGRPCDYWIQSRFKLQTTITDSSPHRVHRLSGTPALTHRSELEYVFRKHGRIWFIANPAFNRSSNEGRVSSFLRRNMDIVYESYNALVFCRDASNRPKRMTLEDDLALRKTRLNPLPDPRGGKSND